MRAVLTQWISRISPSRISRMSQVACRGGDARPPIATEHVSAGRGELSDHLGTIGGMPEHVIRSPVHGAIRVVTSFVPNERPDRPWKAVLDPRPPRLGHLVAVYDVDEAEVLAHVGRLAEMTGPPQARRVPVREIAEP